MVDAQQVELVLGFHDDPDRDSPEPGVPQLYAPAHTIHSWQLSRDEEARVAGLAWLISKSDRDCCDDALSSYEPDNNLQR